MDVNDVLPDFVRSQRRPVVSRPLSVGGCDVWFNRVVLSRLRFRRCGYSPTQQPEVSAEQPVQLPPGALEGSGKMEDVTNLQEKYKF